LRKSKDRLVEWQAENPDDAAALHKGFDYTARTNTEYAKLKYTPFTYSAPQQSRPLDTWVKFFREFE